LREQDYLRERRVFESCLDLPPESREAFLADECSGDAGFRARIERLLEAHAREGDTLIPALERVTDSDIPSHIGSYSIVGILGEGGMGVVYEAEQTVPLVRRVALKVIREGMWSSEVVARFEAERQALALMDHPNIARVFDAGIAESGRPFFVMELVRGVPLLEYCDQHRLTIRQRLDLFVPLCLAVQHAHQKGIIHRDLKPANVLVLERDGVPVPKVIDFGVAKAVGWALTTEPAVTLHGQLVGTPAYMSPEQAGTSGLDVDTRSDVFSLGVMLYELLLGTLPVDPQEVGVHEFIARLVRLETDPPVPSAVLSRHSAVPNVVASRRSADPARLPRELKGDLDWIIMKAMEKDRSLRYASAGELALDIGRHLRDEPVLARMPGPSYRLKKFIRRHRASVAAAAVVLLALGVGAAAITVGLFRATRAERAAREEAARAREMESRANLRLRDSLLAQARATRSTRSPGRRYVALDLLTRAAAIRRGSDLRDEAVAALMLPDLRTVTEWPLPDPDRRYIVEIAPTLDRYLLGFEDGRLEVHFASGGPPVLLRESGLPVRVARFSPDGRLVAVKCHRAGEGGRADFRVCEVSSGREVYSFEGVVARRAFDFSPDGREIVHVTPDRTLTLLDLASGRTRLRRRLSSTPYTVRFRPDGSAIALALEDMEVVVLGRDGRRLLRIECRAAPLTVNWSGDGRFLGAGLADYSASIWDAGNGDRITSLRGHQAEVVAVVFNPAAPIVATYSWDETSRFWELATGREVLVAGAQVRGFSADGHAASFVTRGTAGVWELLYGEAFRVFHGHSGKGPVSLRFDADSKRLVSAGPDGALVWDAETGSKLATLPSGDTKDALFDPKDGSVITCGDNGSARWPTGEGARSKRRVSSARLSPRACAAVASSGDGMVTAFLEEPSVRLSLRDAGRTKLFDAFPGISDVEASSDGKWVAGGNWRGDRTLVWEVSTGRVAARLLPDTPSVNVRFSPDGIWLATGSSDDYRLWRTGTWGQVMRVPRPKRFSDLPGQLDFSGDSRLLAVQVDQTRIRVLHVPSGRLAWDIEMPEPQAVTALRFSGDCRRLAAATSTNQVLVWDLERISEALRALAIDEPLPAFAPPGATEASELRGGRPGP
jgi:eukaryotic-like serine/threonine-protein kinase